MLLMLRPAKAVRHGLVAMSACVVLASCGGAADTTSPTTTSNDVRVARITVSPDTVTLSVGGATTLTATAFDSAGGVIPGVLMAWSGNDHNGELTAIVSGQPYNNKLSVTANAAVVAKINASSGIQSGSCIITVH